MARVPNRPRIRASWTGARCRVQERRTQLHRFLLNRVRGGSLMKGMSVSANAAASGRGVRVGESVGRFLVKQPLSQAVTVASYLVEHAILGFPALLKIELVPGALANETAALSALHSPNVPVLYSRGDLGAQSHKVGYLVQEYIEGTSLTQVLRLGRRLEPSVAVTMCLQLLGALDEAHRLGMVHGAVVPDNVLAVETATACNIRFVLHGFSAGSSVHPPHSGVMRRQPLLSKYTAPEVREGAVPTSGADLFSVGCLLFEGLAGEHPEWDNEGRLVRQLSEIVPTHPDLSRVVAKAVAHESKARFDTAQDFATVLLALDLDELVQFGVSERTALHGGAAETQDTVDITRPRVGSHLPDALKQRALQGGKPELLSTKKPKLWFFSGDPGLDQPIVDLAVGMLLERYDVVRLDATQRERLQTRLTQAELPWMVVFGDLHALLDEPLLAELSRHGETARVLVSTHDNVELLSTTINATGLDAQLSLGPRPDALVELVDAMVERVRTTRIQYDGLRLAVLDARGDVERLQECFERKSA